MKMQQSVLFQLLFASLAISSAVATPLFLNSSDINNNNASERLLKRVKRNKMVQKFLQESKAKREQLSGLDQKLEDGLWPVIAWKTGSDIFEIGDDGLIESSPFEDISEDDARLAVYNLDDFSLRSAVSYKAQLTLVKQRVQFYNKWFILSCLILFGASFVQAIVHYWLIGLSRSVLRYGLKIEFESVRGPKRQEFIHGMAYVVQDDLVYNPASRVELGFAACINDAVAAVESYAKTHS